jgi:hypothetical protein
MVKTSVRFLKTQDVWVLRVVDCTYQPLGRIEKKRSGWTFMSRFFNPMSLLPVERMEIDKKVSDLNNLWQQ